MERTCQHQNNSVPKKSPRVTLWMTWLNPTTFCTRKMRNQITVLSLSMYHFVGDSKRALDEYTSEIMMGGHNTIVLHNTCEDSLLASPIILDLVILCEICQRITFKTADTSEWQSFHPVLSILSYLCKAPLVPPGTPVVNALFKQRACLENIFRACVGLPPINHMTLEHKVSKPLPKSVARPIRDVQTERSVTNGPLKGPSSKKQPIASRLEVQVNGILTNDE